ncbi:MAG: hypothetical protein PHH83_03580 [Patescibacteria group bacterium]|nr:hypothetical protein [Patescibacteria group bacterium]
MSSKNKNSGFVVICDEDGKILDLPPVNDESEKTDEAVRSESRGGKKHHLSNSGTKRPGCMRQ